MPGYSSMIHALLLLALIPLAVAQPWALCGKGNYSASSTYETNLDILLGTLEKNASSSPSLFAKGSVGAAPDTAWALVLCRGDADAFNCGQCVRGAAVGACSGSRDGAVCDDWCYVRVSNYDFLDHTANSGELHINSTSSYNLSSTDVQFYDRAVTDLLTATVQYAVDKSSRMFAMGQWVGPDPGFQNIHSPEFQNIYSVAQCAADLSRPQCRNCLQGQLGRWSTAFLRNRMSARMAGPRCTLRTELTRFYRGKAMVLSLTAQTPAPTATPAAAATATRGSRMIAIVVRFVVVAVVAAC